ncbi:unnamed protein product [Adineta ricciae]|uniref:Nose resistant-to-fluoxetine protein N-terminal domain-containing protein n=1 Tax=Adineta ricciae TaxID=249248 RepID=A0A813PGP6_ADIRI|nr:unnamed protein product [Adineta ricciae]
MKLVTVSAISLIFCIGILAEPPSLSSWNLASYIIGNSEFVQKNFLDSPLDFNETFPWIDVDLTLDAKGSQCTQDLQSLARSLITRQTWALKTLDAWGKFPSGVMQGNVYWTGSVQECAHLLRGLNDSVVEQPFRTRTCVIGNGHSYNIRPVYGICVPKSCSANDLVVYINRRTIRIPFIQRYVHLTNGSIRCIDSRPYDAKATLTIVLLSLVVCMILLFTGMHFVIGHQLPLQDSPTIRSGYEAIPGETIATTTNAVEEQSEQSPLVAQTQQSTNTTIGERIISHCSLINNYRTMKNAGQPGALTCLDGIRVISLCWVILGHTFVYALFYSDNVLVIFNWMRQFWFQIIVQAAFSVDSFFLLSGLLVSFLFFVSKVKDERFSMTRFLVHHYIYRYLRYTIFYAIILLIYIALSPYLGQDGPVYPENGSETLSCRHTWWRNLLYINNFFDSRYSCMQVSWFLATNMQLHWIAPLFLLAASWKWVFGMIVACIFITIDIITTSVIMSKNNYDRGILSDFKLNQSNSSHSYINDVYIKPWCRIAPYAVGLLLGHILHELHQHEDTLSWESILPRRRRLIRSKRFQQIVGWVIALTILAVCVFGTYGDYSGHPLTPSGRIAFHTLARLGWAIGLSIIIVLCYTGYGGVANRFLSHRIFRFLAKLTFGGYLWHSLVLFVSYIGRDQPVHYTITSMLFNAPIYILISYSLSFLTFLFIEMPAIQFLKTVFQRRTNSPN